MNATIVLQIATVLVVAFLISWVIFLAREQRIRPAAVRPLAALCIVALLVNLLSDWPLNGQANIPSGPMTTFIKNDEVLMSFVNSMLLIGIGFLLYEDGELRAQSRLDSSLTAAGLGGMVDHLVDVEVALALLSSPHQPSANGWSAYSTDSRPLAWLRVDRERLAGDAPESAAGDPRRWLVRLPRGKDTLDWRADLVDQCIRRLLGAIRDWAPVVNNSRNGTQVLIAMSELRKDLMELDRLLHAPDERALALLTSLRRRARLLAFFMERLSGADPVRREVLTTFDPLGADPDLDWAADPSGRDMFGQDWSRALAEAQAQLQSASGDQPVEIPSDGRKR